MAINVLVGLGIRMNLFSTQNLSFLSWLRVFILNLITFYDVIGNDLFICVVFYVESNAFAYD